MKNNPTKGSVRMSEAKDTPTRDKVQRLAQDCDLAKVALASNGSFSTGQDILHECASTLRALFAALERAERERDALVAAAYEAAAKACERAAYGWEFAQDDNVELGCLRSRDYIRALTPDDAREALEKVRRKEKERCAKVTKECAGRMREAPKRVWLWKDPFNGTLKAETQWPSPDDEEYIHVDIAAAEIESLREALRVAQQDANDLVLSLETADRAMDRLVRERDEARATLAENGE